MERDTWFTVSFGEWLKRRRKALGLTQQQLALQINCSISALRKFEAEERRPSVQIIEQLLDVFNISSDERSSFLRFARGDWRAAPAGIMEDSPWRASTKSIRSNLPAALTSLVGREQDISLVHKYLSSENIRLVTLIGPPGIGKTSLSQQVATDLMEDYADGVFFVALALLNDPKLVTSAIRQTLRFEDRERSSAVELLKEGIADKQMLLVLDNFEHVLNAASIVPDLLSSCPKLKILVTSREALRVPGEWQYSVPPLAVPQNLQLSQTIDLTTGDDFSALTLFAERARAVRADFNLNSENTKVVAAICTRLDGSPLGIELIAARVRLMSPQELLACMNDQFTLYADGMRGVPERQKTLYNAIAWSYDLLTPQEGQLFAYLGVFAGGFTLEAAQSIFSRITPEKSVHDLVASLLDKSLLQRTFDERGEPRFNMLLTVQQFALKRLRQIGNEVDVRDWHLNYFLELAKQADKEIHGPHQAEWLDILETEHANYRAALDYCITNGHIEPALYLIGSFSGIGRFWSVRNYLSEARSWFDKVRAAADVTHYPLTYAKALNGMSFLAFLDDELGAVHALAEESRRICEPLGVDGELGLADALLAIGQAAMWADDEDIADIAHAEACYEQAAAIYQAHDDHWGWALALLRLGITARLRRDYEKSMLFFEDSLKAFRELDDAFGLARVYTEMGVLYGAQGDYDQACRMHTQALLYGRQLRFKHSINTSVLLLGIIHRITGDYDQAEVYLEESSSICREVNFLGDTSLFYLGCVNLHRGNYIAALKRFILFTRTFYKRGVQNQIGEGLLGLAAVAAGLHQYKRAAQLVGAAQAVHDAIAWVMSSDDRIEIDPLLQIAREQLGEMGFESFAAEGRAMTMEQAVTYALSEKE